MGDLKDQGGRDLPGLKTTISGIYRGRGEVGMGGWGDGGDGNNRALSGECNAGSQKPQILSFLVIIRSRLQLPL